MFLGCNKKYPEDNVKYFSLSEKPKDRITANWVVTKYLINNADSTAFLISEIGYLGKITFNVDCNSKSNNNSIVIEGGGSTLGTADISFVQSNNALSIQKVVMNYWSESATVFVILYNPFIEANSVWKILELTNSSFKITSLINGVNYEIDCNNPQQH
jgi:hypothetical protein